MNGSWATGVTVILARHAETTSNATRTISTRAPGAELTPGGRNQATRLGHDLLRRGPTCVYSSHLVRAVQTARIVAELIGGPHYVEEDLRELDAGELDGRADAEAYVTLNATLASWVHGELDARIGRGGEDGNRLVARVEQLLRRWTVEHAGETVVAVTHGGLIEITVPHLAANLPETFAYQTHLDNCATVELFVTVSGKVTCTEWAGQSLSR